MSSTMISRPATRFTTDIVNLRLMKQNFSADTLTECEGMTISTDQQLDEVTYGSRKNTLQTPKTQNGPGRKA